MTIWNHLGPQRVADSWRMSKKRKASLSSQKDYYPQQAVALYVQHVSHGQGHSLLWDVCLVVTAGAGEIQELL